MSDEYGHIEIDLSDGEATMLWLRYKPGHLLASITMPWERDGSVYLVRSELTQLRDAINQVLEAMSDE